MDLACCRGNLEAIIVNMCGHKEGERYEGRVEGLGEGDVLVSNCPLRVCECGSRGSLLLRSWRCSACRGGGCGRLSLLGWLLAARGHCRGMCV